MKWKEAFLSQNYDACIGRSFRGLVHNLNGVNQALTLQTALFKSMFEQANDLIEKHTIEGCESAYFDELRVLLNKRAPLVGQMSQKVETFQNIVATTLPLQQVCEGEGARPLTIRKIIELAIENLSARSFFKHNIEKHIEVADAVPFISHHQSVIYSILHAFLSNSEEAMAAIKNAAVLKVSAVEEDEWLIVTLIDSGHGIPSETADMIFEPFFTTKKRNLGVGLTCAKEAALSLSGDISFKSEPGRTSFTVKLPFSHIIGEHF